MKNHFAKVYHNFFFTKENELNSVIKAAFVVNLLSLQIKNIRI